MCGPENEPHPANCCCNRCCPEPSYWNGIDPEWYRRKDNDPPEDLSGTDGD